jgi:hypothetical protein
VEWKASSISRSALWVQHYFLLECMTHALGEAPVINLSSF